jgi:hypothetical protein
MTNLDNAKGKPFSSVFPETLKFNEYPLRRLWATITYRIGIRSNSGGKHGSEVFWVSKVSATIWTVNTLLLDFVHQFLQVEFLCFHIAYSCLFLKHVVGSKLSLALATFNHGLFEVVQVSRGFKNLGWHYHRRLDFEYAEWTNEKGSKLVFDSPL